MTTLQSSDFKVVNVSKKAYIAVKFAVFVTENSHNILSRRNLWIRSVKWFCLSVKAYIATLLSRLETNDGKFWSLLVKINDGTATLDVVISDQVCCCHWQPGMLCQQQGAKGSKK